MTRSDSLVDREPAAAGVSGGRQANRSAPLWDLQRFRWVSWEFVLSWLAAPLAIMLLSWQAIALAPSAGFDESWRAGLYMATGRALPFGQHVVFTYGPLGFLSVPGLWRSGLAQWAMAYTMILRFALAVALFAAARASFGRLLALLVAVVVASIDSYLLEPVVFVIAAMWLVSRPLDYRLAMTCSFAAGACAGMQLLNKISVGGSLAVMAALLVLGLPGRRRDYAAAALVGFIGALLVLWLAAGQSLGSLPHFISSSIPITSGYGPAVGDEQRGLGWQTAAALIGLALGLWAGWQMSGELGRRQRLTVLLLWVAFWFFSFKEGFVRHDQPHSIIFFDALLGGFLAFRWREGQRTAALLIVSLLAVLALAAQGASFTSVVSPSANVRAAFRNIRDVLSNQRRAAIVAGGRAEIEAAEPISLEALRLLRGHTVAIWPSEVALAWAYGLDWDPLPVMQSYSAYTTSLDHLDASFLDSSHAPQRILFQAGSEFDNRVTSFDEGQTSRTLFCRYDQIYADRTMAVLARGPDRCARPVMISVVHAGWGGIVPVPAPSPHSLVSVSVGGAGISGPEVLESIFYKPAVRFVRVNGGPLQRFIEGTATDGLPLRASFGSDYSPPFNIAADAKTISVLKDGTAPSINPTLTFTFYTQSLEGGSRL